MVTRWRDNSRSLQRRMAIFRFQYFVDPSKIDPNLGQKMEAEFPVWLQVRKVPVMVVRY